MNLDEMVHVFRTDEEKAKLLAMQIANDRGREVLECLFRGRPKSASEIARELNVPLPTVMFHIERFLEIGIIKIAKTRMSKKLREIKYYGPSKRAILIIPYQKEETISYIKDAIRTSVITPISLGLAVVISAIAGYVLYQITQTVPQSLLAAREEAPALPLEKAAEGAGPQLSEFLSLSSPLVLVLVGCLITMGVLAGYSFIKNRR
ncbi:MAG: helix-turn-helix transcriptional regulator [Theionarchaea archaeon]|nr:helix-turn-helix transcriptional regulator [Theionarchaea archaeon]MBU7037190.1 helix-turn-helix transcriptional regulator [Theionarchaea archaeon]